MRDIQRQNGPQSSPIKLEAEMEAGDEWIEWFGVLAGSQLVLAGDYVWGDLCGGDRFLAAIPVGLGSGPRKKWVQRF